MAGEIGVGNATDGLILALKAFGFIFVLPVML